MLRNLLRTDFFPNDPGGVPERNIAWLRKQVTGDIGGPVNWGVSAAVHAALETPVPAQAEAETYLPSAIEEAAPGQAEAVSVFLPRRRPAVPHPADPGDDTQPRRTPGPVTAVRHQPPDLALLDQVLRGLQRMA